MALAVRVEWPEEQIRLLKSEHERWSGLKQLRGLSTDNYVARYLLDLADVADVNVAPGSVASSLSIVPGVAKSGALFTRALLQNWPTCTYRMRKFIIRTGLQLRPAWAVSVVRLHHVRVGSGLSLVPSADRFGGPPTKTVWARDCSGSYAHFTSSSHSSHTLSSHARLCGWPKGIQGNTLGGLRALLVRYSLAPPVYSL